MIDLPSQWGEWLETKPSSVFIYKADSGVH